MKISVADVQPKFSILLLGTQMAVGGAQKVLLDQARWFHEHGHAVTAVFFYDKENIHAKWLKGNDFPVVNLNAYRTNAGSLENTFLFLKGLWSLWTMIRSGCYDVMETFTQDSNLLGMPLAWLGRIPARLATYHGSIAGGRHLRELLHAWLVNYNIASILIAVSEKTRQIALKEGVHSDRVLVIPNGVMPVPVERVDRCQTQSDVKRNLILLSVGRLVPEKAFEILIRAVDIVVRERPNVALQIAGTGPLQDELQALVVELGLEKKVHLLGGRNDVHDLMLHADIFVMSSRSEGMPMALLEAMSTGLPIVSTQVGGIGEIVKDGVQGILVQPEAPNDLASALLKLIEEPSECLRMGQNARERIEENYTLEHMCSRYESIMLKLCSPKREK